MSNMQEHVDKAQKVLAGSSAARLGIVAGAALLLAFLMLLWAQAAGGIVSVFAILLTLCFAAVAVGVGIAAAKAFAKQ